MQPKNILQNMASRLQSMAFLRGIKLLNNFFIVIIIIFFLFKKKKKSLKNTLLKIDPREGSRLP